MKPVKALLALTLLTSAIYAQNSAQNSTQNSAQNSVQNSAHKSVQVSVTKSDFGKSPDGTTINAYTLKDTALEVQVTTWGAHITSIKAADRTGKVTDVVLGYDSQDGYNKDVSTYMGAVPGRYANRIAKGKFTIDGKTTQTTLNNNGNLLHGGKEGFDRRIWTGQQVPNGVELTLVSPDGDQGFAGKLTAHVTYTLNGDKLRIRYTATTDKPTVVNLTNHAYFNLAGQGDILGESIMIDADKYTPTDKLNIPTGELAPVAGTPFDLRKPTVIGAHIRDNSNAQIALAKGYDHNFVLNAHTLTTPIAKVTDPGSGRTLTVYTTEPGVQFYAGNSLDGSYTGRTRQKYEQYDGLCLETQHYPDSPNQPTFPSTTLKPGQTYTTTTIFQFGVAR